MTWKKDLEERLRFLARIRSRWIEKEDLGENLEENLETDVTGFCENQNGLQHFEELVGVAAPGELPSTSRAQPLGRGMGRDFFLGFLELKNLEQRFGRKIWKKNLEDRLERICAKKNIGFTTF